MTPKPGDIVKHYKGGVYCVLMIAHDEANPSSERVIYCASTPDRLGRRKIWARSMVSWMKPAKGMQRYVTITREDLKR